ncbi:hypothetical protein GCM10011607_30120 [Shewanella inventionis]|uniref:Uncharacterized protein n=1 Tax=Shewanella inventionis TaxID=1738770 RepID=A0ABQ1JG33_9GAMM|nr:hypothetical protein GCM10011607_30120 [Shewanella inventionis]
MTSPFLTILLNGLIHTDVNLAGTTLWHCLILLGLNLILIEKNLIEITVTLN